jgi:hypothetical protein
MKTVEPPPHPHLVTTGLLLRMKEIELDDRSPSILRLRYEAQCVVGMTGARVLLYLLLLLWRVLTNTKPSSLATVITANHPGDWKGVWHFLLLPRYSDRVKNALWSSPSTLSVRWCLKTCTLKQEEANLRHRGSAVGASD